MLLEYPCAVLRNIMLRLLQYKTHIANFCTQTSWNGKLSSNETERYILYIATLCLHNERSLCTVQADGYKLVFLSS
jgi:hypothetical protein